MKFHDLDFCILMRRSLWPSVAMPIVSTALKTYRLSWMPYCSILDVCSTSNVAFPVRINSSIS
jgi:hypothetical protein